MSSAPDPQSTERPFPWVGSLVAQGIITAMTWIAPAYHSTIWWPLFTNTTQIVIVAVSTLVFAATCVMTVRMRARGAETKVFQNVATVVSFAVFAAMFLFGWD